MSWQIHFIGTPSAIKRALIAHGHRMTDDDARSEFDRAREALDLLLDLNTLTGDTISLNASGNGGRVAVVLIQPNAMYVQ